ncbi:MAG: hypothetical protein QOE77_3220 [Blastocatellia bacterium]|jgi:ElaB/YqjD/DUF883 family membrane-anchored ribosome-binding protein|nr:hypothetical protein [Blastocatellia bacterium]
MSQNRDNENSFGTGASAPRTFGGASTGATDAGTTRETNTGGGTLGQNLTPSTTGTGGGTGAATAPRLAQSAQEYGQKIADAATTAKDYVVDKASVVTDKIKELKDVDPSELVDSAKQYTRQNPGQAILISAAAGLILGLVLRGSRR